MAVGYRGQQYHHRAGQGARRQDVHLCALHCLCVVSRVPACSTTLGAGPVKDTDACSADGKGEGFGNVISIQTVAIVRAAYGTGRVYSVDDGKPVSRAHTSCRTP